MSSDENNMILNTIMVPYDGSEHSKRAFRYALDIAKKYNSEIVVAICIMVQDPLPEITVPEEEELQMQKQKSAAAESLSILEIEAGEAQVKFRGIVLKTSSVTDALLSYAESNGIDMIIVGSRGLGGFKKLLLGSVASALCQYSACPVLIVK